MPNPTSDAAGLCGSLGKADRVCSPDAVLRTPEIEALQAELVRIERDMEHSCSGEAAPGFQVVVVAVDKLAGGPSAAGTFTRGVHNSWGVGRHACGDGVVIMLAVGDREVFVTTGDAAGARLTEARIQDIISASEGLSPLPMGPVMDPCLSP